ncbi:hypothetical protein M8C21_000594 [Ambrosia artemisiifolia]|uniref:Uncharacterized protein n=1 Tax=Ambrosia artemisiifolia TaxID=4212 RepID=A0AAD5CI99_AMBAR|nr:hypothetical protein M8C21_000594 [Ambrosia artemisiifolia]
MDGWMAGLGAAMPPVGDALGQLLISRMKNLTLSFVHLAPYRVLYRSRVDGKNYAIKAFRKSQLLKLRVAPSEITMTDVLREFFPKGLHFHVSIMKQPYPDNTMHAQLHSQNPGSSSNQTRGV